MNWLTRTYLAIESFWLLHVQKTLGTVLGSFAIVDLVAAIGNYQSEITTLIGATWYAALRVAGAIAIVIRAAQVRIRHDVLPPPRDGR